MGTPLTPEALVEQLRALREQIPQYVQLTEAEALSLRRVASIPGGFIQATFNTIGASPAMQNALGKNPDALHAEAEEAARWTAVEDELRAMLKGVRATNLVRRHRIGLVALQAYSISRQLVRQRDNADLLPFVQEMKRQGRFGRRRARPQPQPEAPLNAT